jgi:nucleosome binding factor SPN SPT16 subunit
VHVLACVTVVQPFVVSLDDIEHVHFERVGFNSKNFDMAIIFKAGRTEKGSDEFVRISAIPMNKLDQIKDWLLEVVEKVRAIHRGEGNQCRHVAALLSVFMVCSCDFPPLALGGGLVSMQAYTEGVQPFNWKEFIAAYVRQPWFYSDRDANGVEKPVGWAFLAEEDVEEEDSEEQESSDYEESDEDESEEEVRASRTAVPCCF